MPSKTDLDYQNAQGLGTPTPVSISGVPSINVNSSVVLSPNGGAQGLTVTKIIAAAPNSASNIKNSAAKLYGYDFQNLTAAVKFIRFHNKATAPVVGTDSPLFSIAVSPNANNNIVFPYPISFTAGLSIAITGASADLDATAIAASDVIGSLFYF